jgi:hypothetical protein
MNKENADMLRKGEVSSKLVQAAGFSEMLVYRPTWCHMPEDNLHNHHCVNFKSHIGTTSYHHIDILIWKLWLQYRTKGAGMLTPTLPTLAFTLKLYT